MILNKNFKFGFIGTFLKDLCYLIIFCAIIYGIVKFERGRNAQFENWIRTRGQLSNLPVLFKRGDEQVQLDVSESNPAFQGEDNGGTDSSGAVNQKDDGTEGNREESVSIIY